MRIKTSTGNRVSKASSMFFVGLIALTCAGLASPSTGADPTSPWVLAVGPAGDGYLYNQVTGEVWHVAGTQKQRVTDVPSTIANPRPMESPRLGTLSPVTDLDLRAD